MKNTPITQALLKSFNYIKVSCLIKEAQRISSYAENGGNDRKKDIVTDETEHNVLNQEPSLNEHTSIVTSLAIAVNQAQERDALTAQATIETARMWNALYYSRCYQLEWSTKSKELEEIEHKRKARNARNMVAQRNGVGFFINER